MVRVSVWVAIAVMLSLSGCQHLADGWSQQSEVLSHWGSMVVKGPQNDGGIHWSAFGAGLRQDFRDLPPLSRFLEGLEKDFRFLVSEFGRNDL